MLILPKNKKRIFKEMLSIIQSKTYNQENKTQSFEFIKLINIARAKYVYIT